MRRRWWIKAPATGLRWATQSAGGLSAACIAVILLIICGDVFRRLLFGKSIPGSNLYCEVLLVASAFLAMGLAQRKDEHVATSLVVDKLGPRASAAARSVGLFVCLAFLAWLADSSLEKAHTSLARHEIRVGLVNVPIWPARVCLAVGVVLLLAETIRTLVRTIRPTKPSEGTDGPDETAGRSGAAE